MKQDTCRKVSTALFDSDLIATRVFLAIAEFLWAGMLWWPGDSFSRPTYTVMAVVMPEDMWAILFMVTGCLQMYIVINSLYNTLRAHYFALWNASLWTAVVLSMLLSVYPPPAAIAGEVSMMFAAVWIWLRPVLLAHWRRVAYGHAKQDT